MARRRLSFAARAGALGLAGWLDELPTRQTCSQLAKPAKFDSSSWKGGGSRRPRRGKNVWGTFVWTPLVDPYPHSALAMGAVCASLGIWFLTSMQNLGSWIQRIRKIGAQKFWEKELVDGRHAIPLYADSVRWTDCAKTLPGYRQWALTTSRMCASFRSRARSAKSTRHKFGHLDRNFIYVNDWVNLLVLMALNAASRTKWSCSCVKKNRVRSSAQAIKFLAQIYFCSYLPHAASCTKITMTNTIEIGRLQIRRM